MSMILTDQEIDTVAEAYPYNIALYTRAIEQAVIAKLATVSVEPVASFWRERNTKLYPGISIDLTTAGVALPLGERHKLYDVTALAAARVQMANEIMELPQIKGNLFAERAIRALIGGSKS